MLQKKIKVSFITAMLFGVMLLTAACTSGQSTSASKVALGLSDSAASAAENSKSNFASSNLSEEYLNISDLAKKYGVSEGRLALSLIICRLDGTITLDDLTKKDAKELFELLTETATQKSVTLETIDKQYYLTEILHSEGIDVTIQANNVTSGSGASSKPSGKTSAASQTDSGAWLGKFQNAINTK